MRSLFLILGILAVSCNNKGNENNNSEVVSEQTTAESITAEEKYWTGTYLGKSPHGDCREFITVLELRANNTYTKQEECTSQNYQTKEEGRVEIFEGGNITLTTDKGQQSFYKIIDKDHIQLGFEQPEDESARNYTTRKKYILFRM